MAGGVNVPLSSTWNPKGVNAARRDLNAFEKNAAGFKASIGKSFLGFGAAAGGALGIAALGRGLLDMGQAAAEDQKSVVALDKTLDNLGLGSAATEAEAFVKQLMLATGVADDDLRPALSRLLRSTGDVAESQRALRIALDISAATGKDLDTVANGLGKAYDGNAASLGRLGLGLDKALLKSGDMVAITDELSRKFGGQAAAAADTWAGKLLRVQTAAGEAGETIGYELLRAVDNTAEAFGGTDGLVSGLTAAGEAGANLVAGIGVVTTELGKLYDKVALVSGSWNVLSTVWQSSPFAGVTNALGMIADAGEENRAANDAMSDSLRGAEALYAGYIATLDANTQSEHDRRAALDEAATAADRLKKKLDALYGNKASIEQQKINLRQAFAEGPASTTVGKGKNAHQVTTRDQAKEFVLSQAEAIRQLSGDIAAADTPKARAAALRAYRQGRSQLMGTVDDFGIGSDYVNRFLGPAARTSLPREVAHDRSVAGAEQWRANASVVIQQMTVTAPTPAAAVQWAKDAARLAALGRGLGDAATARPAMAGAGYPWGQIR